MALGYPAGVNPAGDFKNVTLHDPRAYPGLNLEIDGHAPEARLRDMDGRILHRWRMSFDEAFPDAPASSSPARLYWRRVRLLPGGELLAIFDGHGLIKLSKSSELIWASAEGAHHDLDVLPDGTIYVLTRREEVIPRLNPKLPVVQDFITVLDPDGRVRREIPLLDAFERSQFAGHLARMKRASELMHTNTLEVLDGRLAGILPAFRPGSVLISLCLLDVIAVVDPSEEVVTWAVVGPWRCPHQPTVVDDRHLLLLNNRGLHGSQVIELDPTTQRWSWSYEADGFFTRTNGSVQRLGNGDTLITESEAGRAFEVLPSGEEVWEFYTPYRAGWRDEMIAMVFEVIRIEADTVSDWLESARREGTR